MFRGYVVRKKLAQSRGEEKGEKEEGEGREEVEKVEKTVSPSGDSGVEEDHGERRRLDVISVTVFVTMCAWFAGGWRRN